MMCSIIKKFIFIFIFCSISFSQTGNEFIREYPHGKNPNDLVGEEFWHYISYRAQLRGIIGGYEEAISESNVTSEEKFQRSMFSYNCNINRDQEIRIIKKWCDNNPSKTHYSLIKIVLLALRELPKKSRSDCFQIRK